MSVDSKEMPKTPAQKASRVTVNRRDFLKASLGVAIAGSALGSGVLLGKRKEVDTISQKIDDLTGAVETRVNGFIRTALRKGCEEWECGSFDGKTFEEHAKSPPPEITALFPGLSEKQINDLLKGPIYEAGLDVLANYDPNSEAGVKNIRNLLQYSKQLRDSAIDKGLGEIAGRFFVGLAAAESHGDRYAVSPAGAAGIIQMMDFVAEKMGLRISDSSDPDWFKNDERFMPERVIPKGAEYLKDEYQKFGDLGYMLQSYHDGDPRMYEATAAYVLDVYGYKLPPVISNIGADTETGRDIDQAETERRMKQYQDVISGKDPFNHGETVGPITMYHLLNNEKSSAVFANDGDYGDKYLYRIIASTMIIEKIAVNVAVLAEASSKGQ